MCTLVHVNGREYRMPQRPTIVVCLDGSSSEYVDAAVDGDAAPFLASLVGAGRVRSVDAAMPTLTVRSMDRPRGCHGHPADYGPICRAPRGAGFLCDRVYR